MYSVISVPIMGLTTLYCVFITYVYCILYVATIILNKYSIFLEYICATDRSHWEVALALFNYAQPIPHTRWAKNFNKIEQCFLGFGEKECAQGDPHLCPCISSVSCRSWSYTIFEGPPNCFLLSKCIKTPGSLSF